MPVIEADFRGSDSLLEAVDLLREKIVSGEVVGFACVGIMSGGGIWQQHDCFTAQKPAIIGGLLMKANILAAEVSSYQMNIALDT